MNISCDSDLGCFGRFCEEQPSVVPGEAVLCAAGNGTSWYHVSLDMDWIDPEDAPGVGTPVRGGATYREATGGAPKVSQNLTNRQSWVPHLFHSCIVERVGTTTLNPPTLSDLSPLL